MSNRSTSLARVYQTCYPLAVSSSVDGEEMSEDEWWDSLDQDRINPLLNALSSTILKQVSRSMEKILDLGKVFISPATKMAILKEMILKGERELYGIRGGTLIVMFSDRKGRKEKIGMFPLDPSLVSTYHIHLTLMETSNIKVKVDNLIRKVSGQDPILILSPSFKLDKKNLY